MGMDQHVAFAPEKMPGWTQLVKLLDDRKFRIDLRMVDGELAFPDEVPPEHWRELRVGTPHGMVTLRREPFGVALVTWGNADDRMRQAWNALAWALAQLTQGLIGHQSAAEFLQTAELPSSLRA